MGALFAGGGAADIVLAVMAAELALLAWLGRDPRTALAALLPGACLALALRAALAGAGWAWVALPLAASLPLHLADLHARGWLGRRRGASLTSVRSGAMADNSGSRTEWRGS